VLAKGHLNWHPTCLDIERLDDDAVAERLRRLPYGGCSLAAMDLTDLEVGDALGVSRQRINQLELKTLLKVRRRLEGDHT